MKTEVVFLQMPSGPAWDLYQEFVSQGLGRVQKALDQSEFEDHFLDYKENANEKGNPTDNVNLAVFAKAASAFANTDAGVIVWGVKDKQDKPRELQPIPNVVQFAGRLTDHANRTLDPPLPGIQTTPIAEADGTGFAVTFIPESDYKPHAAKGKEQGGCYMRVGSNSVPMPMSFVRALVVANARPQLALVPSTCMFDRSTLRIERQHFHPFEQPCERVRISYAIKNGGGVIAEHVALTVPFDREPRIVTSLTLGDVGNISESSEPRRISRMKAGEILHSGTEVKALVVAAKFFSFDKDLQAVTVPFTIHARDYTYKGEIRFDIGALELKSKEQRYRQNREEPY